MPKRPLSLPEFVALTASIFAIIAFSIDAMLPALPEIARTLVPDDVNRAQLILTSFVLGMGIGTLFSGPLSDAFGRKTVILSGLGLYIVGALLAWQAQSIETLLAARLVQGIGAAGPRVTSMAMIRDLYEGRRMAQVTSFVMTVFMLVPAMAPSVGAVIIALFGWRAVFLAFVLVALCAGLWLHLRQPETLPPERRRPLRIAPLMAALREVLGNGLVRIYIVVIGLGFGQMFAALSSTQQIYADVFGKGDSFPLWFAAMAVLAGAGTVLNGQLVMRLGMRRMAISAFGGQTAISLTYLILTLGNLLPQALVFPVFFIWSTSIFFMVGLTFGNLNALALQHLGHIAGTAASIITALATVMGVAIAVPVGLAFNGTVIPALLGTLFCSGGAFLLMRLTVADPVSPAA